MTPISRARGAFAALVLALGAGPLVLAQDDGVPTERMRATIEQRLALVPAGSTNPRVTVRIVDGKYLVAGSVDGIDTRQDAMDAIGGIEGLDRSLLEFSIITQ